MLPISIAAYTGTRAEYGLLKHLIKALQSDTNYDFRLLVSGSHLSPDHGYTLSEIYNDGVTDIESIPLPLSADDPLSMAELCGVSLIEVSKVLRKLQPDLIFLLGDRYETFSAASASHLLGIPVAHLHGGESTIGAVDDKLRHAISQLSTWHFTSAEPYRQRVIAMGHEQSHVFNIGPMVLDGLMKAPPTSREAFQASTGFRFGSSNLLVTYHPETLLADYGVQGFQALIHALSKIDSHILFTYPNADSGSDQILELLLAFSQAYSERVWVIPSLGQALYISAMKLFDCVVGNSSSGVIEAPLVGIPVINLGDRQLGRHRFGPVSDIPLIQSSIEDSLQTVLSTIPVGQRADQHLSFEQTSPTELILRWLNANFQIYQSSDTIK